MPTATPPSFEPTAPDCPACGAVAATHRVLGHKEGARFVQCPRCALWLVSPRPTSAWLAERYAHYGAHLFTDPQKLLSDFAPGRFASELALLQPARGTLLDVGCATGAFVEAARAAGFDARGIDLAEPSVRFGREQRGLPLEAADSATYAGPSAGFDVVTLWATLEHLPTPAAFLHDAHRLLRPGGRLAFSVPNAASLSQRILGFRDRYVGIDHVNYFTAATASRLCARAGFAVRTVRTARINPVVIWQDLRGRTPDGASIAQQLSDQAVTDRIKHGGGGGVRALRQMHRVVERAVGGVGLGDTLYVVAERLP